MNKGPDQSAFPIPRKGGAKPIAVEEMAEIAAVEQAGRERAPPPSPLPAPPPTAEFVYPALSAEPQKPVTQRTGLLAVHRLAGCDNEFPAYPLSSARQA